MASNHRGLLFRILKRDGDNCWLCSEPMAPPGTRKPNGQPTKDAATLEHVIERRNGGHTTMGNCRASHHRCNTKRDEKFAHTAGPLHPGNLSGYIHPQPERNKPGDDYLKLLAAKHQWAEDDGR